MTTLPFDAELPLWFNTECAVAGCVSTDDGTSAPYFRIETVSVAGEDIRPSMQHRPADELRALFNVVTASLIAQQVNDPSNRYGRDLLDDAKRIEKDWRADAMRDFREAAE
ncbi:hypothetical protein LB518_22955 [Mesorhizobium sp. BR1-1-16]|uniref:hypothetical protein n=1 Tax=Mesorhizobium sp. BR1-1-16 TaxID=2876653 RepID=UPI001CCC448B|nr:hypothetical protein [Mesorhizobium sp. BR1-1-16]MBZ9939175.1 hypothetical protein [Mesorhizobium sp. BR1-1-16]